MTPVEVVLGRVLLGVVHAGADAVPGRANLSDWGGVPVSKFCAWSRCFCGPWLS